jgi:hypothetical protein
MRHKSRKYFSKYKPEFFFFWLKIKFIHSKSCSTSSHNTKSKLLKTKKDEPANKLTVASELIAYNGNKMPINTKKLKCLKYPCFQIYNVDDAKIIVWICTRSDIIREFRFTTIINLDKLFATQQLLIYISNLNNFIWCKNLIVYF